VSLFSVSTILAYIAFGLTLWAVYLLSKAIYWQRSKTTPAVANESGVTTTTTPALSFAPNHAIATASIKANAILQILTALISGGVNVGIIAIVVWGLKPRYVLMNQTNGTAIITAPFFCVLGYFGYTAGKNGSNVRLVVFLCLSVLCGLLAFLEGGGASVALADRDPGMWVKPTRDCWGCDWPANKLDYYWLLITLNSVVIVMAVLHLLLSIWGVVIASRALHKDDTCARCCTGCFGRRCTGCSVDPNCDAPCADCCSGDNLCGDRGKGNYLPIQFVVKHQGMTTMADGQQALLVLLPLNGNMKVQMSEGAADVATVSVETGTGGGAVA